MKNLKQQKIDIIKSERDKQIFSDALINPPKPNEALLKAAKEYKKIIKS